MKRFHKKVYMPIDSKAKIQNFTDKLNDIAWKYSAHALDNIKHRAVDNRAILLHIKGLTLSASDVFEYYADDKGEILKAVYRIDFEGFFDLCLVISKEKNLVTIYINTKKDNHDTLDKHLYVKNTKS